MVIVASLSELHIDEVNVIIMVRPSHVILQRYILRPHENICDFYHSSMLRVRAQQRVVLIREKDLVVRLKQSIIKAENKQLKVSNKDNNKQLAFETIEEREVQLQTL